MPAINMIVGIDQTGAQHPRRHQAAKALPIAVVSRQQDHWNVTVTQGKQALHLNRVSYEGLIHLQESFQDQAGPLLVAIDCVLGMPQQVQCPEEWGQGRALLLRLFLEATHYHHKLKDSGQTAYGLNASRDFFRMLQTRALGEDSLDQASPQRWVEALVKANSVFRERPFQKNIQSGTFRIWSDLGSSSHLDRIHIWPFDDIHRCQPGDVMLMECYPSHLWRVDWEINRRSPERFLNRLQEDRRLKLNIADEDLKVLAGSIDHCDALVNALGFLLRWQADPSAKMHPPEPQVSCQEGWILGAILPEKIRPGKVHQASMQRIMALI